MASLIGRDRAPRAERWNTGSTLQTMPGWCFRRQRSTASVVDMDGPCERPTGATSAGGYYEPSQEDQKDLAMGKCVRNDSWLIGEPVPVFLMRTNQFTTGVG